MTTETITNPHPNQDPKTWYNYNYQGMHYRVFAEQQELRDFLNDMSGTPIAVFLTEADLDAFLAHA